ncbi:hypothetical protein BKA93DRAFT_828435 [Sparassis latifolia]|uniref:F-box domain-containing protein n=1 Tax=Sparassis crispa TaxID=139825 RepID=A0A401H115_9APHY|nr:hypothetical protein SCP_1203330 [Sparassis crispa]GBE88104.1 hypothetical protein SCP_1203330 [Sparassis crispa]
MLWGRSRLPLEVYDYIIDLSREESSDERNYTTLRSCALTCRAWLARSQYNLFHTVELNTREQLHAFSKLIDQSPRLATFVQELIIKHPDDNKPFRLMTIFPIVFARKLPRLRSLTLESPYATPSVAPFHRIYFIAIHEFASITDLQLFHVEFRSFSDFARLVSNFPNLLAVECWNVSWLGHGSNPFALGGYRSRLRLNDLTVDDVELSGLAQLMHAVGSSLQHLTFGADNQWMESFVSEQGSSMVDLTGLRSLQIPVRLDRTDFGWIKELLSRYICSQLVRALTFSFHYGYSATPLDGAKDVLLRIQGAGMEDILVGPQFSQLKEVVFQFSSSGDTELPEGDWEDDLVSQLPKLRLRGIAKVELTR